MKLFLFSFVLFFPICAQATTFEEWKNGCTEVAFKERAIDNTNGGTDPNRKPAKFTRKNCERMGFTQCREYTCKGEGGSKGSRGYTVFDFRIIPQYLICKYDYKFHPSKSGKNANCTITKTDTGYKYSAKVIQSSVVGNITGVPIPGKNPNMNQCLCSDYQLKF